MANSARTWNVYPRQQAASFRPAVPLLFVICLTSLAAASGPSDANPDPQASEIVTDRPDITEASTVVPKESLQVEGGLTAIKQPLGSSRLQGGFFSPSASNSFSIYKPLGLSGLDFVRYILRYSFFRDI